MVLGRHRGLITCVLDSGSSSLGFSPGSDKTVSSQRHSAFIYPGVKVGAGNTGLAHPTICQFKHGSASHGITIIA